MALPPSFLDELRARTPIAAVIGRTVRLARKGRQWTGCCPFHNEKTPSFYVYDDHYHCFGCGAHGDAIGFVMQAQGLGFMEAVEQLAGEAGLEVPRPSPQAEAAAARARSLHDVLEAAAGAFQRRLFLPEGEAALAYLRGRGLNDNTIRAWGLGWSGEGRGALAADLARDGITPDLLAEAGLMKPAEGRDGFVDYFFNRVMFPIRDRRGRPVSFGGRILGDGHPKYVNGPETPVFSKRRTLYGLDRARTAPVLIVVEGYMDVIALDQAGIAGAVAPLGTALTEEHLEALWRACPMPVLCFDGDAAGARAAVRAAELALPLLTPAQGLKLLTLPAGEDPDTLVAKEGTQGFAGRLAAARPLSQALFGLMAEGASLANAESRAALRTRLIAAAARVQDKALAAELRSKLLDDFFRHARPQRPGFAGARGGQTGPGSGGRGRGDVLRPPRPVPAPRPDEQARILLAILLRHPALLSDLDEALGGLDLPMPWARLKDALLAWAHGAETLDSQGLLTHLHSSGMGDLLTRALAEEPFPLPACARSDAMPAEAVAGWWHFFQAMRRDSLAAQVAQARLAAAGGEAGALARLAYLREAQLDLLNDDPVPGPS